MKLTPAQLAKLIAIVTGIVIGFVRRQTEENGLSVDEAIELAEKRQQSNSEKIDDLLSLDLE